MERNVEEMERNVEEMERNVEEMERNGKAIPFRSSLYRNQTVVTLNDKLIGWKYGCYERTGDLFPKEDVIELQEKQLHDQEENENKLKRKIKNLSLVITAETGAILTAILLTILLSLPI